MAAVAMERVQVEGLEIAYREAGSGPPVLLVHGWPTSSHLWRDVMPAMAARRRVIAIDLPGFGASAKPLDVRYDFDFFERVLDGFLAALDLDRFGLVVHDIGGPIGVHWALRNPGRLTRLAMLNTLLFPEFSPMVVEFVTRLSSPDSRAELTSAEGLEGVIRFGVADEAKLTPEAIAGYVAPFPADDDQKALARAGIQLPIPGFAEIADRLGELRDIPVRIAYGDADRILPDVAETMARVSEALPEAAVTVLPGVGHFLQEEAPDEVGALLAEFFAA